MARLFAQSWELTRRRHALLKSIIARRTVLKGMGATLALPFLEAMLPASTLRAADKPVRRFQAFYTPNGMAMEYWSPKTEGADFEMTPILEPLAPVSRSDDRVLRAQAPAGTTSTLALRDPSSPARRAVAKRKSKSLQTFRSTS